MIVKIFVGISIKINLIAKEVESQIKIRSFILEDLKMDCKREKAYTLG